MADHQPPEQGFHHVEQLLNMAREDGGSKLGALLEIYRGFLLQFAAGKLSPGMVAKASPSDLVQETLVDATQGFPRFNGTSEPQVRKWLKQILSRKVIDTFRSHRAAKMRDVSREVPLPTDSQLDQGLVDPKQAASPLNQAVANEKFDHLKVALSQLSDVQRRVIELRSFERCSFEEIGRRIGKSGEAVRKHWTDALRRLSVKMRELRQDDSSFT